MTSRFDDTALWRLDTFLVPPGSLSGGRVVVDGDEGRHAARVVRVRPGDRVRLTDGEGSEAVGDVVEVTQGRGPSVVVGVVESRSRSRGEGATLVVAQAVLKGGDFGEVVRRCAELGVAAVVPVTTARVQARAPAASRVEHWRGVARAALKQSRGVFATAVEEPRPLGAFVDALPPGAGVLVAWEEERTAGLREALRALAGTGPLVAVVGPEGGLDPAEVRELERVGARTVSLGHRVLRADWAAAALAAAVSLETGGLLP